MRGSGDAAHAGWWHKGSVATAEGSSIPVIHSKPGTWFGFSRPLVVIALMLAVTIGIGVVARTGRPAGQPPAATRVQTADLVMRDNDDGSITVTQAGTGAPVATVSHDTNGFLRVVLAGLVRERRREDQGSPATPFRLTRWSDGRLTIDDTATGRLIELEAFGPSNEAAFARLLALSPPPATR